MQDDDVGNPQDNPQTKDELKDPPSVAEAPQGKQQDEEDEDGASVEEPDAQAVPTSNVRRRLRNLVLICAALWLAMTLFRSTGGKQRSKVIYASRYSEEFKYRPAASPVITERLQDGRTRIRGAEPTARAEPPVKEKPKTRAKKRRLSKRNKTESGK